MSGNIFEKYFSVIKWCVEWVVCVGPNKLCCVVIISGDSAPEAETMIQTQERGWVLTAAHCCSPLSELEI